MTRSGITLVEMLVVLSVLGVLGGMSVLALNQLRQPAESERITRWRQARVAAIRSGLPVEVSTDGMVVRFLPDGRGIGDSIDPLTGEALRATK